MRFPVWKIWALVALLAFAQPQAARAVTTTTVAVTNSGWTDISAIAGVGALQFIAPGPVAYAISDTTPAIPFTSGFKLSANVPAIVNTSSHVWVVSLTSASQTVSVAPVSGGGGGAGGTVGIDQTTPGTTNGVYINGCGNGVCSLPTIAGNALVKGTTAAMTATTSTQVIAAVASQHIYVTSIHCNNSSANATLVNIQDGASGTTLDTLATGATLGGDNRNGGNAPLFWTTIGNGLYAADVTTGASVICQAAGYSSAS